MDCELGEGRDLWSSGTQLRAAHTAGAQLLGDEKTDKGEDYLKVEHGRWQVSDSP